MLSDIIRSYLLSPFTHSVIYGGLAVTALKFLERVLKQSRTAKEFCDDVLPIMLPLLDCFGSSMWSQQKVCILFYVLTTMF